MNSPLWGQQAGQWLRLDCRHYRGDRPCAAGIQGVCPAECRSYHPQGHRILIIKLGALGDVIRTAALLPGLKELWPQSHITWISRPNGVRILANHPLIDRRLAFNAHTLCQLEHERFDLCLSLDKEPGPAALAMRVDAPDRRGIGLTSYGTICALNPECVPYFLLGLDDDLKFRRNQQSYQELIYEAIGLTYRGQRYRLYPDDNARQHAAARWRQLGVRDGEVVIALNTGAGRAFANKNWPLRNFSLLADRLIARHGWRVALLGGAAERRVNASVAAALPGLLDTGADHSELEFAALLERCQVLVTGDTMAMHVAIACGVPCVVLFGPTCPQEIDLYGRGERIVTSLPCAPCYRRRCHQAPTCMDAISVEEVLAAVQRCVAGRAPGPPSTQDGTGVPPRVAAGLCSGSPSTPGDTGILPVTPGPAGRPSHEVDV